MKFLALVLISATLALAYPSPPIEVVGRSGEKLLFDCEVQGTGSAEYKSGNARLDNLCKDFPANIDSFPDVDLEVKFYGIENINHFKEFVSKYSAKIKAVEFHPWAGEYKATFQNFQDVFNSVPNCEKIYLSGWLNKVKLEGEGIFNLNKLRSLEFTNNNFGLLSFFADHLPHDVLTDFKFEAEKRSFSTSLLTRFIENQKKIVNVDIKGNPFGAEPFKPLKLQKLVLNFQYDEEVENQKTVINDFIKDHPEITEFNLLRPDYFKDHLDDTVFGEICHKLQKLATFKFNIDGISKTAIKELKNLKSLKSLALKTDTEESTEKFDEFSKLQLPGLEKLTMKLWGYDLPDSFYEQLAANFVNLKSFESALGVTHSINFFMKTFPNLENLKITFGQANNHVSFEDSYEDDGLKHDKMKKLGLEFTGKSGVESQLMFKARNAFPNLENVEISGTFPFEAVFFKTLYDNLGKIKTMWLSTFDTPCNEAFEAEKIEILKKFGSKLDSVNFVFNNVVDNGRKGDFCLMRENGKLEKKSIDRSNAFSFTPFAEALKDDFYVKYDSYANIKTHKNLRLFGGKNLGSINRYHFRSFD